MLLPNSCWLVMMTDEEIEIVQQAKPCWTLSSQQPLATFCTSKNPLKNPDIGLVTIYRTLDLLNELNLVCRVHAPDGRRSYMMRRPTGHHHHLVCSGCGKVVDFTGCALADLEQRLSKETRFDIKGHLLEFYGLCPDCRLVST